MSYRSIVALAWVLSVSACMRQEMALYEPYDGSTGPDFAELDTPVICTSGIEWRNGDHGSTLMHPGLPCIDCHAVNTFAPGFRFAGTVYPSGHEPDDCYGARGIDVTVTGADGLSFTVTSNGAGNFYLNFFEGALTLPYTAKIARGGRERVMTMSQMTGDCNGCHTQDGTMDAPGRIVAP